MALPYQAPGVYIEEVSTGAKPITAVGTSTAGFVGTAPNSRALVDEPTAINNWGEFCKKFVPDGTKSTPLSNAVFGYFLNGGRRCFVVNIGSSDKLVSKSGGKPGKRTGLECLEPYDVQIIAAPGFTSVESYEALIAHCEKLKNRVAILDPPEGVTDIQSLCEVGTATKSKGPEAPSGSTATKSKGPETSGVDGRSGVRPRQSDNGYGAFYFPEIMALDPIGGDVVNMHPSGHLAGMYARVDGLRGVHKAPANEVIRGAVGVGYRVTQGEQEALNPKSVNCIRFFPGEGIRVWGGRTLAASSSEWKYINVRRLFIMICESIQRSTTWVVFEPNNRSLWKSIIRDVKAFLTLLWRQGALMGLTPETAFFVQCDEETNPPEVIDAGQVIIRIGIAPVKPAEFVVFEIGQSREGAQALEL